jgi:hypothetical protein
MSDRDASPLPSIERAVQDRAKSLPSDLEPDDHDAALRELIEEEIERWQVDHRRGLRSIELAQPTALADRIFRNLARFGPLTSLLEDDDVWEIMINAPDGAFNEPPFKRVGHGCSFVRPPAGALSCATLSWEEVQGSAWEGNTQWAVSGHHEDRPMLWIGCGRALAQAQHNPPN